MIAQIITIVILLGILFLHNFQLVIVYIVRFIVGLIIANLLFEYNHPSTANCQNQGRVLILLLYFGCYFLMFFISLIQLKYEKKFYFFIPIIVYFFLILLVSLIFKKTNILSEISLLLFACYFIPHTITFFIKHNKS